MTPETKMARTQSPLTNLTTGLDTFKETAKNGTEALLSSSKMAFAGLQSLAQTYQTIAHRNLDTHLDFCKSLSSVKTLDDALDLQHKAVSHGIDKAVADSQSIVELTTSVVTETLQPVKKHLETTFQSALH